MSANIYLTLSGTSLNSDTAKAGGYFKTNPQRRTALAIASSPSSGLDHSSTSIKVLCGDNPPTLTNGWAKWATIDRPLARGVTVFQGYDPVELTCELRFGTWAQDGTLTWEMDTDVEANISVLESWMGTKMTGGRPSVVYVHALDNGKETELVPPRYWGMPWIITNVQYGESYRNTRGKRVRQDATVTLTNYNNSGIGGAPPTVVDALAQNILHDSKNNPIRGTRISLGHKGMNWKIPLGKSVWVPGHVT